jgi:hypothetical protein
MSTTVHVEGISHKTTEKEVQDFFSFCGKIQNISVKPSSGEPEATKSASVTFEKESAAKTALLLDSTQLGDAQVHVKAAQSLEQLAGGDKSAEGEAHHEHDIPQEEKPRTRIIAEYLAHGYRLSDQVVQRAISFDQKNGISSRFSKALSDFDTRYKATERTRSVDTQYGVTSRAAGAWSGLNSYFEKAINTPSGQKVRQFYEVGSKQVMDVHNEAMHLANLKKQHSDVAGAGGNVTEPAPGDNSRTVCQCGSDTQNCPCAPGTCACNNCAKNPEASGPAAGESEKAAPAPAAGETATKE